MQQIRIYLAIEKNIYIIEKNIFYNNAENKFYNNAGNYICLLKLIKFKVITELKYFIQSLKFKV